MNPTQFGPGEDFDKYPRNLEADLAALAEVGATWVYAPSTDEVYRGKTQVHIEPGPAGRTLEGAMRPGHFAGVLQVVGKVMNLVRPTSAIFGQKDAQQFVNIRQMVHDLDMELDLIQAPIFREDDGLALSSRNAYLDPTQRALAPCLHLALEDGAELARQGVPAEEIIAATANRLLAPELVGKVTLQYVALARRDTFEIMGLWAPTPEQAMVLAGQTSRVSPPDPEGTPRARKAYLLVAAKIGETRLIDNVKVQVLPGE